MEEHPDDRLEDGDDRARVRERGREVAPLAQDARDRGDALLERRRAIGVGVEDREGGVGVGAEERLEVGGDEVRAVEVCGRAGRRARVPVVFYLG